MRLKSKFTDRSVKALKHRKKQYDVWEAGRTGLGIRMAAAPSRRKSWTFIFRYVGVSQRMALFDDQGNVAVYPAVSVSAANRKVLDAKRLLADGIHPGKVQKAQQRADREAKSVKERVGLFIERQKGKDRRAVGEHARVLNKDVVPRWGDMKVKAVTRADVSELVEEIAARGAPVMARRTHAYVHGFFEYCIGLGLIEVNPAAKVDLPGHESERTRILSPKEMRTFWWGLDKARTNEAVRLALRFQLATILRRSEVAGANHEEFDEREGVLLIPAGRSKNRVPHRVWLSPLALSILDEARGLEGSAGWLFPSPKYPDQHISPRTMSGALKSNWGLIGVSDLGTHDLRRTGSSNLSALGVPRHIRERVLNHVQGRLDRSYDRYEYDEEKKEALAKWGLRLEQVIATKHPVVDLDERRKKPAGRR